MILGPAGASVSAVSARSTVSEVGAEALEWVILQAVAVKAEE